MGVDKVELSAVRGRGRQFEFFTSHKTAIAKTAVTQTEATY